MPQTEGTTAPVGKRASAVVAPVPFAGAVQETSGLGAAAYSPYKMKMNVSSPVDVDFAVEELIT